VEEKLARVPFTSQETATIAGMARWMRFMAVVGLVAGFLLVFFVVLGFGLCAALQGMGSSSPELAKFQQLMQNVGLFIYLLLGVFLIAALASLWQSFALYQAGDYFGLVARTDDADVDHLASGLDKLRTFFKVQVLLMVASLALAVCARLLATAFTMRS